MSGDFKISFYTKASLIPEGKKHITLLFPFFGNYETNKEDTDFGRFDAYSKEGAAFFSLTDSPETCDFFLLPFEFSFLPEHVLLAQKFAAEAEKINKKVVVFFNSDSSEDIPIANVIVFRTSFYKTTQKKNEFAFPGWSCDFQFSQIISSKTLNPSISYCGYVDYLNLFERFNWWRLYRKVFGKMNDTSKVGTEIRGKAVRKLLANKQIQSNFIIRKGFWAGGMNKQLARKQYIENMYSADYALVVRGAGNFSYRLNEVLSCGKIPVFINTDCVLPYDELIDWKKYVVWIEEKDIELIAIRLIEFHQKMSVEELKKRKEECRMLYENWLSPVGFFSKMHNCLH